MSRRMGAFLWWVYLLLVLVFILPPVVVLYLNIWDSLGRYEEEIKNTAILNFLIGLLLCAGVLPLRYYLAEQKEENS